MSTKNQKLNLYVATIFGGKGRESSAGWVRKNGNPDRLPSGSQRIKMAGKKRPEFVARTLAVGAALRDVEKNSSIIVHVGNADIADLINATNFRPYLRKAGQLKADKMVKALQHLDLEIARHQSVKAVYVDKAGDDSSDALRMLEKAYNIAAKPDASIKGHGQAKNRCRRKQEDQKAIDESIADANSAGWNWPSA